MAELTERHMLSVQDLEKQLGVNRLPVFIQESEADFLARTQEVVEFIASHPSVKAVFVSGPTSSGKTTFTERLTAGLSQLGRPALRLSLDDYYDIKMFSLTLLQTDHVPFRLLYAFAERTC